MPRTKSIVSPVASGGPKMKKKSATKTIHPKKKARSVLVDVIEDEPLENDWPEEAASSPIGRKPLKNSANAENEADAEIGRSGELDSQKKFFSSLSPVSKDKETPAPKIGNSGRSVGLYRRFVVKFVILVAILAAVVVYFSFSKLTVSVNLKGETINDNLLLSVAKEGVATSSDQTDPRMAVSGSVKEIAATVKKTYSATGEEFVGEEIVGQVRIINNYNKSQTLVATTRILSPDNKLFRIKNAVSIPAGGETNVNIYAEKPAANLAIGPTTFSIPGLWLGLQDKIYAKSDTAFTFQRKVKKYIKSSDLDSAAKDINELLLKTAQEKAGAAITDKEGWLYNVGDPATVTIDAKEGEQKEEFTAEAAGKIVAVSFSREQAAKLAAAKLNLLIPDDKELAEFKPENIEYSLDNYDAASGSATIKASFSGTMILKSDAEVVARGQLVNLNEDQIITYLKNQAGVKDYELKFSPSFIKKAPSLVDRITIKVNKD